jgi:hypothetical protein
MKKSSPTNASPNRQKDVIDEKRLDKTYCIKSDKKDGMGTTIICLLQSNKILTNFDLYTLVKLALSQKLTWSRMKTN